MEARVRELAAGPNPGAAIEQEFGETGLLLLRTTTGHPARLPASRPSAGQKHVARFARMALDDLFATADLIRDFAPLLGFLGRAPDNIYNAMVVYVQNPLAREWKTREEWARERRRVREGAQPLLTLFPFGPFRIKYDVADTEGPPRNDGPGLLDAEGHVTEGHWGELRAAAADKGFDIRETRPFESRAAGFVSRKGDRFEIAVEMRGGLASQFATVCHELAHVFLGHLGPDPRSEVPKGERAPPPRWPNREGVSRAVREVEAEGVAYILCRRMGIVATAPEYISGFLERLQPEEAPGIELMVRTASTIGRIVLPE